MDTGQWLVIGLCAFLLLWYLIGWLFNRRRGHAVLVWLKTGLGTLGKPGETRWLSPLHSSAQVIVADMQQTHEDMNRMMKAKKVESHGKQQRRKN